MKRFLVCLLSLLFLVGCSSYVDPLDELYPYDLSAYIEPSDEPLTISGWKIAVSDADVEQQVLLLRSRYSELKAVTGRGAADMDYMILTYECRIDGKLISSMSETEAATVLGSDAMLPEIEAALYGKKEGDSFFVDAVLPTPYKPDVSYSGAKASFYITVVELDEQTFRPYTDENVEKSTGYKTVAKLETAIREALFSSRRDELAEQLLASAWKTAAEKATVHGYPEDVLTAKFDDALSLYTISAGNADMTLGEYAESIGYETEEEFREALTERIKKDIRESMLTVALARQHGITVSEEEYNVGAAAYAESIGLTSTAALELIYDRSEIAENILLDKVQDYLVKTATIVDYDSGEELAYAELFPETKTGLSAGWYILIAAGAAAVITAAVLLVRQAIRRKKAQKSAKKTMLHPNKKH